MVDISIVNGIIIQLITGGAPSCSIPLPGILGMSSASGCVDFSGFTCTRVDPKIQDSPVRKSCTLKKSSSLHAEQCSASVYCKNNIIFSDLCHVGKHLQLPHFIRFWTKPHFIAVDEPTNYLDVETVEALSKALLGRLTIHGLIMIFAEIGQTIRR